MVETKLLESNKVEQKLQYWISQLRDMGHGNRLLYWKNSKTSSIVISEPDAENLFERIVVKNKPIYAPLSENKPKDLFASFEIVEEENKESDIKRNIDEFIADKSPDQLNRVLKNLRYKSLTIREEQGFNALFMAFGMLKWQENNTSEFSEAPLVLVPIDIDKIESDGRYKISLLEEEIVTNPTLQAKLANEYALEFKDVPHEISTNDLIEYWSYLNKTIKNLKGWEVLPKVIIGVFNFQTLQIIKDLESNSEHYAKHPLIQMLSGILDNFLDTPNEIPTASELDDKVDPLEVFQILDADSSQQEAIEAAKRGVSFVLQGPPGTGKSQTIANIIAESLATGKKILFVSQKSVALDVVYNRLLKQGLGEFCLEVHSYKKNKKDVIEDLGKSLKTLCGDKISKPS